MKKQLNQTANLSNALLTLTCLFILAQFTHPLIEISESAKQFSTWLDFFLFPILFFYAGLISGKYITPVKRDSLLIGTIFIFFSYQYAYALIHNHLKHEILLNLFEINKISLILLLFLCFYYCTLLINSFKSPIIIAILIPLSLQLFDSSLVIFFYFLPFFVIGYYSKDSTLIFIATKQQKIVTYAAIIISIAAWFFFQPENYILLPNSFLQGKVIIPSAENIIFFYVVNTILLLSFITVICGYKQWYFYSNKNLLTIPIICALLTTLYAEEIETLYISNAPSMAISLGLLYILAVYLLFTPLTNFIPWLIEWCQWVFCRNEKPIIEISAIKNLRSYSGKLKLFLSVSDKTKIIKKTPDLISITIFSIFLVFIVCELSWRKDPNEIVKWFNNSMYAAFVSVLFLVLIYYVLRGLFSRAFSYIILAFFTLFAASLNVLKLNLWGLPLLSNDFYLFNQVYGSLIFLLGPWAHLLVLTILIVSALLAYFCLKNIHLIFNKKQASRMWALFAMVLIIILYLSPGYLIRSPLMPAMWQVQNINNQYTITGFIPSFIYNFLTSHVNQDGYDSNAVKKIVADLPKEDFLTPEIKEKINVIVIQSEAFWDPVNLSPNLFPEGSPANLDNLCKETNHKACQSGYIEVPVFGGGTANTEFEFLTGITTKLFPSGAIPYVQYIHRPTPSIVWRFKQAGYNTIALHPFSENFWNRKQVYPHLGFSRFLAIDDFKDANSNALYVSDEALTDKVINTLYSSNGPLFLFAVSMANHGPFADDRYDNLPEVQINWGSFKSKLNKKDKKTLRTYSIGVRESVKALKVLLQKLGEDDAPPTVVVFYGDHLPLLGSKYKLYRKGNFITSDEELTNGKLFATPYLIWSNTSSLIDLPAKYIPVSYLGQKITQEALLRKTYFSNAIEKAHLNPIFYKMGGVQPKSGLSEQQKQYEELYKGISFNMLFGGQDLKMMYGLSQ